jgi:hypothetical protein
VIGHLVDADLLRPRAALQEEVVQQIEDEVAGVEDVVALPRLAERVGRQRSLAGNDEVVADALLLGALER